MNATRSSCITLRTAEDTLAEDVRRGLTAPRKWLHCKYFYDSTGSALFERICELSEYYLTRAEESILRRWSEKLLLVDPPEELIELGSGSARKSRHLIAAALRGGRELTYYPIDIAASTIESAAAGLVAEFADLRVVGLVGEYADGLSYLAQRDGGKRLVVFLGSTIGNFNDEELSQFLTMLRASLGPRDSFLLGFDLLKDRATLLAAYDDREGVTARFNLNLLVRLNRELRADFDLRSFRHRAVFNEERSRVEMHLVSSRRQTVRLAALELEVAFAEGETIFTENCYKHSYGGMTRILERHGFAVATAHGDERELFCVLMARTA